MLSTGCCGCAVAVAVAVCEPDPSGTATSVAGWHRPPAGLRVQWARGVRSALAWAQPCLSGFYWWATMPSIDVICKFNARKCDLVGSGKTSDAPPDKRASTRRLMSVCCGFTSTVKPLFLRASGTGSTIRGSSPSYSTAITASKPWRTWSSSRPMASSAAFPRTAPPAGAARPACAQRGGNGRRRCSASCGSWAPQDWQYSGASSPWISIRRSTGEPAARW